MSDYRWHKGSIRAELCHYGMARKGEGLVVMSMYHTVGG